MTGTLGWRDLPSGVRAEIASYTGEPAWTTPGADGWSTDVRLIMETPELGQVFVKGLAPGKGRLYEHQRARLELGADLAEHVQPLSPDLLFRANADGWSVTAWAALPGTSASFAPKSEDVPKAVGLLAQLQWLKAPEIVTGSAVADWGRWTDSPEALEGDVLVHGDPRPENFMVYRYDAWLVDWGHALRGPAWLTSALAVLELIEAGWHPRDAEEALQPVQAWSEAPGEAVQVFADANASMWRKAWEKDPGHRLRRDKSEVAMAWASYRETGW